MERQLDKMEAEWGGVKFELVPWKDTGGFILKVSPSLLRAHPWQSLSTRPLWAHSWGKHRGCFSQRQALLSVRSGCAVGAGAVPAIVPVYMASAVAA